MSFLHPEFLYYTLLPVLVLFIFLLKQKEKEQLFFSKRVLQMIRVPGNALSMRARNALFFMVSLLIVVALAQPVIEEGKVTVEAKSADIMVALDISDSMLAEDLYPNRVEHAKQKIMQLLEGAPQERIGVMAFAKNAYLVSPLSFDHRAVMFLVKQLQPGSITEKGTDFVQLLDTAAQAMRENERKYLLILTDGGDQNDFGAEIALAKKEGMQIFVLGTGTHKGAPIKLKEGGFIKHNGDIIVSSLNQEISSLATQTGGAYIESVASSKDIEAMLAEIVRKTEKRTLAEEEIPMYTQLFYYPVGLALLFLLFATSSFYRKSTGAAALLVITAIASPGTALHAGLLDFQLLKEAKERYEAGDYNRSAELYSDYAGRARSDASYYNQANALYKQGSYASAAELYAKVSEEASEEMAFSAKHNLGNAYAKQGTPELLQKALEAYEAALQLKEDTQTRENYEAVKKLLEQQEQPSEESQQSKEKQEQSKSDDDKQSQEADEKNQDEKQSQSDAQKPSQQKSQKDVQQEGDGSEQMSTEPEEAQDEQEEAQQAKSEKPEEKEAAQQGEANAPSEAQSAQMSEMEAKKWFNKLGQEPVSHIYRLMPTNPQEENENAKPW